MGDVYVSIRGRILLNVEALNMTESIGNYVKHRRVPVIVPSNNGYSVYFVPAISGESIAHGYQVVLAEEAVKNDLPVCKLCKDGIFLKSTNRKVFEAAFQTKPPDNSFELEKMIISHCVVEDVGGFLYAEAENVKRTSRFLTGYMIPTKESIQETIIDAQMHSRYALGTPFVKEQGQMIYHVELSSSVYTFSFDLESKYIGKATFTYGKVGEPVVDENERIKRIEIALDALKKFLIEFGFGAKKTRFLPISEWESVIVAVSDDIWTVPHSLTQEYGKNAIEKLKKIDHNTKLFIYGIEPEKINDKIEVSTTFEDVLIKAMEEAKRRII